MLSTGISQQSIPVDEEIWPVVISRMVALSNDPNYVKENIGVFNLPVDCSDEVKKTIYTLQNHFLVHKLFIRKGIPNLEIYRMDQGFLSFNQYGGTYNLAIHRSKEFDISKVLDVRTVICENGHEMNVETLRDFFKSDDLSEWFCGICRAKFVGPIKLDNRTLRREKRRIRRFGKKQVEKLDKIHELLGDYKIFPEENLIMIISKLLEAKTDLTANELSSKLNNDGLELSPYLISNYFKKRNLRKIVKVAKKHPHTYCLSQNFLKQFA